MKLRSLAALLAILALIAAACGSDDTDTATDSTTTESTAPETGPGSSETDTTDAAPVEPSDEEAADSIEVPTRIVSLSPTATETLFAIGAGDNVIAVDNQSNFPEDAPLEEDLSGFTPSVEAIAAFEPDLILSSGAIEGIDVIEAEVLVLPPAVSLDDAYSQIEQIGAATGHIAEAAELVLQMQTEIAELVEATEVPEEPLTYFHEVFTDFYTAQSDTFPGAIYSLFGLANVADGADDPNGGGYPQLTEEFLLAQDPDIIFLADVGQAGQTADVVAARPGWEALSAVENGRIVELDDDEANRWGPRIVEFVRDVSEAITATVAAEETVAAG